MRVSPSAPTQGNQEKPFFTQFRLCGKAVFLFMATEKNLFLHKSGRWYFRQWIPLDLRCHFGNRPDVSKSLKTSDRTQAVILVAGLQQRYQTTFTLLRTGILSHEQALALVAPIAPISDSKQPVQPEPPVTPPQPIVSQVPPSPHTLRYICNGTFAELDR